MLSRPFLFAATAAALLAGLSACGKQGQLQRPAPLFGEARAVFPSDLERGAPDETSAAENQREDARDSLPSSDERTRPRDAETAPAAPVNIPPT